MQILDTVVRYFDIRASSLRRAATQAPWLPQWLAVLAGVLAEPVFDEYRRTAALTWHPSLAWAAFSVIVSLAIFPAVYKNTIDPDKPLFVQVCAIFTAGLGWQGLLEAASTVAR